jgi:hypothetical protein
MKAFAFTILALLSILGCTTHEENNRKTVWIKWINGQMSIPDKYKLVSYQYFENLSWEDNQDSACVLAHLEKFRSIMKDTTGAVFLVDSTNHFNYIVITPNPYLPITQKTEKMLVAMLDKKGKEPRGYNMTSSVLESSMDFELFRRFNYIKINQQVRSDNGEKYNSVYVVTKGKSTVSVNFNNLLNTDFEEYVKSIQIR